MGFTEGTFKKQVNFYFFVVTYNNFGCTYIFSVVTLKVFK